MRLLQVDVDRKKILLKHFTGSLRSNLEGAEVRSHVMIVNPKAASTYHPNLFLSVLLQITASSIIEAAHKEDSQEQGKPTAEIILEGLYVENQRLKRDMRMLGEELSGYRRRDMSTSGCSLDGEVNDEEMIDFSSVGSPESISPIVPLEQHQHSNSPALSV